MSSTPKLAIVAALEREIRPLVKNWRSHKQDYEGRTYRFYENSQAVLICGGIGPAAARRATQAVIALYSPELIYSAGFAGAANEAIKVGDLLIPRRVINASDGSSVDTGTGQGILVTFPEVASPEQKAKLAASFGAQAVDMEASSVAQAAGARSINFAAVKAISDEIDFALPPVDAFITSTGQFRTSKFALFLLVCPWLWTTALRLARNSSQAQRALSTWLQHMIESHSQQHPPAAHPAPMETSHPR